MTITQDIGESVRSPTEAISLEELDGSNRYEFAIVNASGQTDVTRIAVNAYPRTATQISQGGSDYDDFNPPYKPIAQVTWEGGRGQERFEDDRSRYLDAYRNNTGATGLAFNGPEEHWMKGARDGDLDLPGDVSGFTQLSTGAGQVYQSYKFTASASYTAKTVMFIARKNGTPTAGLQVHIYSDSAGEPNASLGTIGTYALTSATADSQTCVLISAGAGIALTGSTTYHVVFQGTTDGAADGWALAMGSSANGFTSTDAATWGASASAPYVAVMDDATTHGGKFLEYKSALYFLTQPHDLSASTLYLNGDRGAADASSSSSVIDATKSWTTNEWAGAIVMLTEGTGAAQPQNWRTISSNNSTTLVVSTDWDVTPDTTTSYVILGSNTWTQIEALGSYVTDAAVVGEQLFYALGQGSAVLRRRYYNLNGTWTAKGSSEGSEFQADYLLSLFDPDRGPELWGTLNDHPLYGVCFWRANVPSPWGKLYTDHGQIAPTDEPWDETVISAVQQVKNSSSGNTEVQIATGFTTGIIASKQLTEPVDVRQGLKAAVNLRSADVDYTSDDLTLILDDTLYANQTAQCVGVWKVQPGKGAIPSAVWNGQRAQRNPTSLVLENDAQYDPPSDAYHSHAWGDKPLEVASWTAGTFTDMPLANDGSGNTNNTISMTASVYMYVCSEKPFSRIQFDLGATFNSVNATMAVQVMDGRAFTNVTVNSDTTISGSATFGQDGYIDFDKPPFWPKMTLNGIEGYWARLIPNTVLTTNVNVREVYTRDMQDLQFEQITSHGYGEWTWANHEIDLDDGDGRYFYLGAANNFDQAYFDFGSDVNNNAGTIVVEYYANSRWNSAAGVTDGTASGGAPFATDGTVSWSLPSQAEKLAFNSSTPLYWYRFSSTADTDPIRVAQVRLFNTADAKLRNLEANLVSDDARDEELIFNTSGDSLYVGYSKPFTDITFDVGAGSVSGSGDLSAAWFNGHDWSTVSSLTDGTHDATRSLAQTGTITGWDRPIEWVPCTINGVEAYYIRLSVNGALTAYYDSFTVTDNSADDFQDMPAVYDGDTTTVQQARFTASEDHLYVCSETVFDTITVNMGSTVNSAASAVTVYYATPTAWTALTHSDGTRATTATFSQDGDITFALASDWVPRTIDGVTGYWIRLEFSADLDDDIEILQISVQDSDLRIGEDFPRVYDGDSTTAAGLRLDVPDYLYIMGAQPYNEINVTIAEGNTGGTTMSGEYWDGANWTTITTLADGTNGGTGAFEQTGNVTFGSPTDWKAVSYNNKQGYMVRLTTSNGTSADTQIQEIQLTDSNRTTASLSGGFTTSEEWGWVTADITPATQTPLPNSSSIVSVRLQLENDRGAQNFSMQGGLRLISEVPSFTRLASDVPITGITAYGREKANPWILTEKRPFEVIVNDQTQATTAIPIPLGELDALRSSANGQAAITNDVYLYFNIGQHLERYFQGSLEDLGPNRDEGLPGDRQGDIDNLISYPGRVMAIVNGGTSGYSSLLFRRGSGWHELYRAPFGIVIEDTKVQVIPGDTPDRLWFSMNGTYVHVDLPSFTFNPTHDENYRFTHQSHLVTSWIDGGFINIEKLWTSLELTTENLSSNVTITAYYQVDTGDLDTNNVSGWTPLPTVYTTSPYQEVVIATNYVTGNRIRFKLVFHTNDNATTPILNAMIVNAIINLPVKYSYPLRLRLQDDDEIYPGHTDGRRAEEKYSQLKTWSGVPPVPVKLRSPYSSHDSVTGVLQAPAGRPLFLEERTQNEGWIVDILFLEI